VNVSTFREAIIRRFRTTRWFRRIYVYGAAAGDGVFPAGDDTMIALIAVAKLGKTTTG
jgi:predicted DNA-binding helix-hairpin-helix protein